MIARLTLASCLLVAFAHPARADVEHNLTSVYSNCGRMIRLQREVRKAVADLERTVASRPDREPTAADLEQFCALAARQKRVIEEADDVIAYLEDEGTAVAFTEIFTQLRDDMKAIELRLQKGDFGEATRRIENDVLDTLQEMIAAVRRPNDV